MFKLPWSKGTLGKGQIIQRLESLHCTEVEKHVLGGAMWKAPTGQHFSISYEECDAKYLQGIVDQIEEWVREAHKKSD